MNRKKVSPLWQNQENPEVDPRVGLEVAPEVDPKPPFHPLVEGERDPNKSHGASLFFGNSLTPNDFFSTVRIFYVIHPDPIYF